MARRNKAKGDPGEVEADMTSMIDVVFLLLIFFMLATKFKMPEGTLRSYLPKNRGESNSRPILSETCRITLMSEGGQVRAWADQSQVPLNDQLESDYEQFTGIAGPNLNFIEDHIMAAKASYVPLDGNGSLPVVIDFGKEVPYKYVIDVLNICARQEIVNIAFAQPEIPLE